MHTATKLPSTVALTACPADEDGTQIFLSGLFDIVEHCPYEPAAYVHSPGFIVGRPEDRENADAPSWWIDEADMIEQADPSGHGRSLVQEREMGDYYHDEPKPYFACPMGHPESFEDDDKGHVLWPTGREQSHDDFFAGTIVATETRCIHCGMIRWDVG